VYEGKRKERRRKGCCEGMWLIHGMNSKMAYKQLFLSAARAVCVAAVLLGKRVAKRSVLCSDRPKAAGNKSFEPGNLACK
jgi:hypothetical protein